MAANNFEKSFRNRTISKEGRGATPERNTRENWTFKVDIDPGDKTRLRGYCTEEMGFYNLLVEGLSARLRAFPKTLVGLSGPWEDLFADLAAYGTNLRKLTKPELLPEHLKRHGKVIFESGKRRPIQESTLMIFELAACGGNFHPEARRAMALEMLRFYRRQAEVASEAVPVALRDEQVYKQAPEILETVNNVQKRHVQLPRSAVKLKFDDKAHKTSFFIPYARKPIVVEGDFTPPNSWNLLVLRQAGGQPSSTSPWLMDVKKTGQSYLVKMLDSFNPYRGSSFHAAKSARSAL